MHKIAIVVGTRPEVIKLAPVIKAIREGDRLEPYVISTGQQGELLKKALDEFEIKPDYVSVQFYRCLLPFRLIERDFATIENSSSRRNKPLVIYVELG